MPFNVSGVFSRLYSWVTDRDTGVKINAPRMDAEFDGIATAINAIVGQTQPFIAQVKTVSGTVSAPAIAPDGDANTGVYFPAADQVAVAVNGAQAALYTGTGATFAYPFFAPAGTASAPSLSFTGDTNTGVYSPGADQVALATGGVQRVAVSTTAITATLPVRTTSGTSAAPAFANSTQTGTGVFFPSSGTQIGFSLSGSQIALLSSGSFNIGTSITGTALSYLKHFAFSVTGTNNAVILDLPIGGSLVAGLSFWFLPTAANSSTLTINVDGTGAKSCFTPAGVACPANYLRSGVPTHVYYDGTSYVVDRAPEYGSNANGEYWRYADGRQVCINYINNDSVAWTTADGSFFRSASAATWTYPAAFATVTPTVTGAVEIGTRPAGVHFVSLWSSSVGWYGWGATSAGSGATKRVTLSAIGRWY